MLDSLLEEKTNNENNPKLIRIRKSLPIEKTQEEETKSEYESLKNLRYTSDFPNIKRRNTDYQIEETEVS